MGHTELDNLPNSHGSSEVYENWRLRTGMRAIPVISKMVGDGHAILRDAVLYTLAPCLTDDLMQRVVSQWVNVYTQGVAAAQAAGVGITVEFTVSVFFDYVRQEYVRDESMSTLQYVIAARLGDAKDKAQERPSDLLSRLRPKYMALLDQGRTTLHDLAAKFLHSVMHPAKTSMMHPLAAEFEQGCRTVTLGQVDRLIGLHRHAGERLLPLTQLASLCQGVYDDLASKLSVPEDSTVGTTHGAAPTNQGSTGPVVYYCSVHGHNTTHTDRDCKSQHGAGVSHSTSMQEALQELRELFQQLPISASAAFGAASRTQGSALPAGFVHVAGHNAPKHLACGRFHRPDVVCYGPARGVHAACQAPGHVHYTHATHEDLPTAPADDFAYEEA